ncbi:MAG TPA: hypothetical protein VLZ89_06930 [Anaerolineales bacterium]|nr:hypothetical protein [Anaerolineales bacterium]
MPLHLTVENTGPALNARVQVAYLNDRAGQISDGQDISLPSGSRQDLFLYLLSQGSALSAKVSLTTNGQSIASANLALVCNFPADDTLVGMLTDHPSSLSMLKDLEVNDGFAQFVALQPADLPDRPEGWSSLDALVVSETDTKTLNAHQRHSLEMWLNNGGRLIVAG